MAIYGNPSVFSTSEKGCLALVGTLGLVSLVIGIIAIAESQTAPHEGLGSIGYVGGACFVIGGFAVLAILTYCYKQRKNNQNSSISVLPSSNIKQQTDTQEQTKDHSQTSNAKGIEKSEQLYLTMIENEVVHIGQRHWTEDVRNDPERCDKIFRSQHAIALYLLENNVKEVFVEGEAFIYHYQDFFPTDTQKKAKKLFPDPQGIPQKVEDYTDEQKKFLMETGAANTLFYLGKIDTLHPTNNYEEQGEIQAIIAVEYEKGNFDLNSDILKPLVMDRRELLLLESIKPYALLNKDKKIFIIYGLAHHLEKYFNYEKFTYIEFDGGLYTCSNESLKKHISEYTKTLVKEPYDFEARYMRALLLTNIRKYKEALDDTSFLMKLNPTDPRVKPHHESLLLILKKHYPSLLPIEDI